MSLVFSAITPHPPIIVPGVGSSEDLAKCQGTVSAMTKLADYFNKANIETLVIISPHSPSAPQAFTINVTPNLKSNLADFGAPQPEYTLKPDSEIITKIMTKFCHTKTQLVPIETPMLDHGVNVPLHYLLSENESVSLVSLGYTNDNPAEYFSFGQQLGSILDSSRKRIAYIASGDLSHRLNEEAPAGFSPKGKEFDDYIVKAVSENDPKKICAVDESLTHEAGECGLRAIASLLGVIHKRKTEPEVLSYEGPFGVGYLVTYYKFE